MGIDAIRMVLRSSNCTPLFETRYSTDTSTGRPEIHASIDVNIDRLINEIIQHLTSSKSLREELKSLLYENTVNLGEKLESDLAGLVTDVVGEDTPPIRLDVNKLNVLADWIEDQQFPLELSNRIRTLRLEDGKKILVVYVPDDLSEDDLYRAHQDLESFAATFGGDMKCLILPKSFKAQLMTLSESR